MNQRLPSLRARGVIRALERAGFAVSRAPSNRHFVFRLSAFDGGVERTGVRRAVNAEGDDLRAAHEDVISPLGLPSVQPQARAPNISNSRRRGTCGKRECTSAQG